MSKNRLKTSKNLFLHKSIKYQVFMLDGSKSTFFKLKKSTKAKIQLFKKNG